MLAMLMDGSNVAVGSNISSSIGSVVVAAVAAMCMVLKGFARFIITICIII